jgi:hypothetical protein
MGRCRQDRPDVHELFAMEAVDARGAIARGHGGGEQSMSQSQRAARRLGDDNVLFPQTCSHRLLAVLVDVRVVAGGFATRLRASAATRRRRLSMGPGQLLLQRAAEADVQRILVVELVGKVARVAEAREVGLARSPPFLAVGT